MRVSIRPLHRVFAGEVSGIDCRKPLSAGEIDVVEAGMNEYAVLIFRDQNLTDEEQIAFTRGNRGVPAGAAAAGPDSSGKRPQNTVSLLAHPCDRRVDDR